MSRNGVPARMCSTTSRCCASRTNFGPSGRPTARPSSRGSPLRALKSALSAVVRPCGSHSQVQSLPMASSALLRARAASSRSSMRRSRRPNSSAISKPPATRTACVTSRSPAVTVAVTACPGMRPCCSARYRVTTLTT
jgi:hypothetical protein